MPEESQAVSPLERDQLLSVKETLVGIVIAFVMAFVFRGFVIEGFVIPTGSMAPTLLGEHFRAEGPESGYGWDVGPTPRSGSMQDLDVIRRNSDGLLEYDENMIGIGADARLVLGEEIRHSILSLTVPEEVAES